MDLYHFLHILLEAIFRSILIEFARICCVDLFEFFYKISPRTRKVVDYCCQKFEDCFRKAECGICFTEYGDTDEKIPRVLSCGHTYCEGCIMKLGNLGTGCIVCPFCTRKIYLDESSTLESFTENHLLLDEITRIDFPFPKPETFIQCTSCYTNYSCQEPSRTPRIHPECGHTSCEACVEKNTLEKGYVTCLTCDVESSCDMMESWRSLVPINYAIRDLLID